MADEGYWKTAPCRRGGRRPAMLSRVRDKFRRKPGKDSSAVRGETAGGRCERSCPGGATAEVRNQHSASIIKAPAR